MTSVVYYQRLCTKNINKQLKVKCRERLKLKDLSGGQRELEEAIRNNKSHVCWKYQKLVYKKYDSRGSTENVKKSRRKKVWTIALAEKFSEVWEQIGKPHCLTLQTDLTILKI